MADVPTEFERETCTRCGGSGRWSWTREWGDACFSCGKPHEPGPGTRLSKRGAAAVAYMRSLLSINGKNLEPGMRVWLAAGMSGCRWITIEEIGPDMTRGMANGETEWTIAHERNGALSIRHAGGSYNGISPESVYRVAVSPEQRAEAKAKALAYQACLTKAGKLRAKIPPELAAAAGLGHREREQCNKP